MTANDTSPLELSALTKRFGATSALDRVDYRLPRGAAVGLVGRNGSGKTTLLQTAAGLLLPTEGACRTLGRPVAELGEGELARIGYVDQECELLDWMTVDQHVRYVAAFQPRWDDALATRLQGELELPADQRVGALSMGMRQRLAVLLAVGHRPELLLLDEPVSAQDPLAREQLLRLLLERVIEDGASLLVSSHVLHDVEKVVDRILCLDAGRIVEDASLDELKERYAEWVVTAHGPEAAPSYDEPFVLAREGSGRQVRLAVRAGDDELERFRARHGVQVERRRLDLERIYPLIASERRP